MSDTRLQRLRTNVSKSDELEMRTKRQPVLLDLLTRKRRSYGTRMTTQQKTAAIRSILTNHEDNLAAVRAANVGAALDAVVLDAMNTALKDDLVFVFASELKGPEDALGLG